MTLYRVASAPCAAQLTGNVRFPQMKPLRHLIVNVFLLLTVVSIGSCWGYQEYWDQKVKSLCEKDGGVVIFEEVNLTDEIYKRHEGRKGHIRIPSKRHAKANHDFYLVTNTTNIKHFNNSKGQLYVQKIENMTYRKSDEKLMEKTIYYFRRNGDILHSLGMHQSSFGCISMPSIKSRYDKKFYKYEI